MAASHPHAGNNPFPSADLWDRLDPSPPGGLPWECFLGNHQNEWLQELRQRTKVPVELFVAGQSYEGRTLLAIRFGNPEGRRVLVWARQHGNEPDCTAGLCMALEEILLRPEEPLAAGLLAELHFTVLPMVNPDGVLRFTRRSAQQIDINRDAVAQATPEGRALFRLKEEFDPEFCFNLHDMNPRKSAEGEHLVVMAVQAGPFEPRDIDNEVRLKAKMICGIMAEQARQFAPKNIARYTADYMHRAFGDSMMRWGVASILIEAGGWHEEEGGDGFVRRLFAHSFLRGLHAVANREDAPLSGDAYDTIPFDSFNLFSDVLIEKAQLVPGAGAPPFRADISFDRSPEPGLGKQSLVYTSVIQNIGDLEDELSKRRIAAPGSVILPGFVAVSAGRPTGAAHGAEDVVRACHAAGITTLLHAVGPFEKAEEAWSHRPAEDDGRPSLRFITFERVAALAEIIRRHGASPLAGLAVDALAIPARDIVRLSSCFKAGSESELPPGKQDVLLRADLFYHGSGSLLVHLSPARDGEELHRLAEGELEAFTREMPAQDSPVMYSTDALDQPLDWLPLSPLSGGLSRGRLPTPQYIGHILRRAKASEPDDVVATLSRLPGSRTLWFLPPESGQIVLESRADLAIFPDVILAGGQPAWQAAPTQVVVNGTVLPARG